MKSSRITRAELITASAAPHSPETLLFATLLGAQDELLLLGLSEEQLRLLYARHFGSLSAPRLGVVIQSEEQAVFIELLSAFLLNHAHAAKSVDLFDAQCVALIIAHACLRPDHLWRDLGLSGREEVTDMLSRYFPALVARNTNAMRWKKFLAQELALSLGKTPQPAPGCPSCEDFAFCFGNKT
jgi:nitrogen fixation protein NifQ